MILSEDDPAKAHLRQELLAEHVAFLDRHRALLLAAGPLRDDEGRTVGGLILLDVKTREEAERLFADDPFTRAGLRGRITYRRWGKAYLAGEKLIP